VELPDVASIVPVKSLRWPFDGNQPLALRVPCLIDTAERAFPKFSEDAISPADGFKDISNCILDPLVNSPARISRDEIADVEIA
jgi:hypothetical protein